MPRAWALGQGGFSGATGRGFINPTLWAKGEFINRILMIGALAAQKAEEARRPTYEGYFLTFSNFWPTCESYFLTLPNFFPTCKSCFLTFSSFWRTCKSCFDQPTRQQESYFFHLLGIFLTFFNFLATCKSWFRPSFLTFSSFQATF